MLEAKGVVYRIGDREIVSNVSTEIVPELSYREKAQRRALLPQAQQLNSAFPAFDVVLMGRSPHVGRSESEADYRIAGEALEELNATHLANTAYTVLSGGEKQRIALARASAQIWEEPPGGARYLLLDEPTNNLDLAYQHIALGHAKRWSSLGVGVLVVLHDLNLASQYADRVMVMNDGRCMADGDPSEVFTSSYHHTRRGRVTAGERDKSKPR